MVLIVHRTEQPVRRKRRRWRRRDVLLVVLKCGSARIGGQWVTSGWVHAFTRCEKCRLFRGHDRSLRSADNLVSSRTHHASWHSEWKTEEIDKLMKIDAIRYLFCGATSLPPSSRRLISVHGRRIGVGRVASMCRRHTQHATCHTREWMFTNLLKRYA